METSKSRGNAGKRQNHHQAKNLKPRQGERRQGSVSDETKGTQIVTGQKRSISQPSISKSTAEHTESSRKGKPSGPRGGPGQKQTQSGLTVVTETVIQEKHAAAEVLMESTVQTQPPEPPKKNEGDRQSKKRAAPLLDSNWKRVKQLLPPPKHPRTTTAKLTTTTTTTAVTSAVTSTIFTTASPNQAAKILALDCEMVGDERRQSMLARVCVVNESGEVLYDRFVKPISKVADYRTRYSGIQPHHLTSSKAVTFLEAQQQVADLIRGNIVVGHGLKNDFAVLKIEHPRHLIRDTSHYHQFKSATGQARKLKYLVLERLNYAIQDGRKGHDPSVDAKAALELYSKHREEWEASLARKRRRV